MSRSEAYVTFKLNEGKETSELVLGAKKRMKAAKEQAKIYAAEVNAAKGTIAALTAKIDAKKEERKSLGGTVEEIIDEEEYSYIGSLKTAKNTYKTAHHSMLTARSQIQEATAQADEARKELLDSFNAWYAANFNDPIESYTAPPPPPPENKEVMDDDEQFEQMQMQRVLDTDPESLAFERARANINSSRRPVKAKAGRNLMNT